MRHVMKSSPSATASVCVLGVAGETFGINSVSVQEAMVQCSLRSVPLAPSFVAGVLMHRGDILLAVSLRSLLGMEKCSAKQSAVVMRDDQSGESFALLVDELVDVMLVDQQDWEPNPATLAQCWMDVCSGAYRTEHATLPVVMPEAVQPTRLLARHNLAAKIGGRYESPDRG
jgi:purine-binding chemotaxis protein CheW